MKILYYQKENQLRPAIATGEGIIDLLNYEDTNQFKNRPLAIDDISILKNIETTAKKNSHLFIAESSLVIAPCILPTAKIICIGLNYRKHAIESGMQIPQVPVLFSKFSNSLTNYGSNILLGNEGSHFDYEVELGVVIGRKCKNVSKEKALDYVFGYCVANDLSCRDLQFKTSQWLLGKTLDQFLPLGKYVVTADEIGDPQNLQLKCSLNGELKQNSNTSDMIFSVAEIIEFLSKYMTLEPGDLIITGTPEGVIMGLPANEQQWLKPGDRVKVEIEKLGYTENLMI